MDQRLKEGFAYRASDNVATYSGSGALSTEGGTRIACQFQADQEFSGSVQVMLRHISPTDFAVYLLPLMESGAGVTFRGTTESGATLVMASARAGRPLALDADGYGSMYYLPHKVTVHNKRSPTMFYHFLLTNFAFSPFTHLGEPPHQPPPHLLSLNIDGQSVSVAIRPLPDYVDRVVRLWQTRSVIPTCDLEIAVPEGMPAVWPFDLSTRICKLLSVAAGTVVEWIVAEGFDQENQRTHSIHAARPTKAFCSLPIVPIKEFGYETNSCILQTFLQGGLEQIRQRDAHAMNGLIGAFLDARLEGDHLESRGIKTAVVLEMLKDLFAEEYCLAEWDKLLPGALRKKISRVIQSALKEHEIEPGPSEAVKEVLGQLSHPSFRRIVSYMIGRLSLTEDDNLVKGLIGARNSLIHTGQFLSMSDPKKAKVRGFTDAAHEFFLLLSFVDRVLLRVLGHVGFYTNYSGCTQLRFVPVIQYLPVRREESTTSFL